MQKGEPETDSPFLGLGLTSTRVSTEMGYIRTVVLFPRNRRPSHFIHHLVPIADDRFILVIPSQCTAKRKRLIVVLRMLIGHTCHPPRFGFPAIAEIILQGNPR